MGFYIGVSVVLLVFFGMAAIGSWRRRGRRGSDLLPDAREDQTENVLRQRSHPRGR